MNANKKIDYCNCRNCGAPKEFTKCNYCGTCDEKINRSYFISDLADGFKYQMLKEDSLIIYNPNQAVIFNL